MYTQVESELVSIRAEWTQTIADLRCNLLMIFGLAIAVIFLYIHRRGAWRAIRVNLKEWVPKFVD